jgi:GT2 family glycosyltransferase
MQTHPRDGRVLTPLLTSAPVIDLPAPAAALRPLWAPVGARTNGRLEVDGKFFARRGARFPLHGVTYGTFMPRPGDEALVPPAEQLRCDLAAIAGSGFTVVRTYTEPPADMVSMAEEHDLQILAGIYFSDWRDLVGSSRRETRRVMAEARETVRAAARRLARSEHVFALCLGNEIPADVVRWFGTATVAGALEELAHVVHDEAPELLVTYANYPTAEYLPLDGCDFLTFNVYLERRSDLRRYLTRLQNLAGDRPVVLGELGVDVASHGEAGQAALLDWQLETAVERGVAGTFVYAWTDEWAVGAVPVEDWRFGLTCADRSPRPALAVAERWNGRDVRDLQPRWPSLSVVICAYDAEATLDECLTHTCALDYPGLEVLVVDDGSTDGTAAIARRHPRARLLSIEHAGLSVARNAGLEASSGEVVAYLDSDAFPTPEWPYYLVLAFDSRTVGGVGGPNIPPPADGSGAERVARSPGGPVHVLVADDRAEHVPGCNMAFWRDVIVEVGGFDPIFRAAGDDVDMCWKVLDRGWEIGFHPAAMVFHHRRAGLRAYLRQQRGYGRSEALVEARHPDRFTPAGSARWRGRIYNPLVPTSMARQRVYRGPYGAASYQSVYGAESHGLDLAHQVGVPLAAAVLGTGVLAALHPWLAVPALVAAVFVTALFAIDVVAVSPPRRMHRGTASFRASVAVHHLLQPLVRTWGRVRATPTARAGGLQPTALPGPVRSEHRVLVFPEVGPRSQLAELIVGHLRMGGLRVASPTGWEDHDGRVVGSGLVAGEVVTSSHPAGAVSMTVRRRLRWRPLAVALALIALALPMQAAVAAGLIALVVIDITRGLHRIGPGARRLLLKGAA